jgi:hypothetical protein
MTHEEIKNWLDKYNVENYTIRPDGIVDVDNDVNLRNFKGTTLPVQFGEVSGHFDMFGTNITSLVGFPVFIGRDFICSGCKNLTSIKYAPRFIGGGFYIHDTSIKSLTGVDKVIKHISGMCWCDEKVTHILGLLLIKGITDFNIDNGGPIDKIMKKYAGTGDILSAQDELIDAGFIDQARL